MEGIATKESGNGVALGEAPKLKRSMGVWMATALVVGNVVGSGIFLLPASLAGVAGPIWWQAKQAEKQVAELVATPIPARSPTHEGAVVAMKESR